MAKQTLYTLKNWFRTSLKPTQAQFWDWLDSFWHKDEKIPLSSLDGLQEELDNYATKDFVANNTGSGVIDDANTSATKTWSSEKIAQELEAIGEGTNGLSAYEIAVNNGFVGTEAQWLVSLQGNDGADGVNGVDGQNGTNGADGANGLSAYEIAVNNGFVGTEAEWLVSLQGNDGADGVNGVDGQNGTNGADGANGLSAYEIAVNNGFVGTEAEWLISLQGNDGADGANGVDGQDGTNGADGANGLSAYEIAVNNGFVGTEAQWLVSLQGNDGADGVNGVDGQNGTNGADGTTAYEAAVAGGYTGSEAEFNDIIAKAGVWLKDTVAMACSDETGDLTASTTVPKIHYVFRDAFTRTLNSIVVDLNTAPTGSSLTVDVKKNGVSIFSTLLTIDGGETSNITAATPYVLAGAVTFAAGDYIDVYVTITGSTTAGKGMKINLLTTKS